MTDPRRPSPGKRSPGLRCPVAAGEGGVCKAAARFMRDASATREFVLLSSRTEEHYVMEALRAGIRGYVLKAQAAADLLHAIREG